MLVIELFPLFTNVRANNAHGSFGVCIWLFWCFDRALLACRRCVSEKSEWLARPKTMVITTMKVPRTATHCSTLQRTATTCSILPYTAAHCNSV